MTVMKKLKLKLQGLQKKKGAVAEDEVGLLGMYSVLSVCKLCCKSKIIDSERLKCTNGMENFFYVICVEALGSCSVACHNLKSLGKRNFYCVCSKKCTKALNFEDRTVSTLRIKWLF